MNKADFIELCLTYTDAVVDRPFDLDTDTTVARHADNRKWFALIFLLNGRQCVNLKLDPMKAEFFRSAYFGITAGWHMNHIHWSTLCLESDVPDSVIEELLSDSHALTANRKRINNDTSD
ncbi:MAG: MmcQ/YjbR family DNA-binding protein [Oscillospiraceae bacterium]